MSAQNTIQIGVSEDAKIWAQKMRTSEFRKSGLEAKCRKIAPPPPRRSEHSLCKQSFCALFALSGRGGDLHKNTIKIEASKLLQLCADGGRDSTSSNAPFCSEERIFLQGGGQDPISTTDIYIYISIYIYIYIYIYCFLGGQGEVPVR